MRISTLATQISTLKAGAKGQSCEWPCTGRGVATLEDTPDYLACVRSSTTRILVLKYRKLSQHVADHECKIVCVHI